MRRCSPEAREGVRQLNIKHGEGRETPFHLLHRKREWNPSEGVWMGWERKRGKLVELNRWLSGEPSSSYALTDPGVPLPAIRYVITLDADSLLTRGGARRLIATLAHPLNQAAFDPATGALIGGYTVLQPRVRVKPTSVNRSILTRLFAGDRGLDLYTQAVSDVYQDLFQEGIFVGKGIMDVAAFHRSLEGRVPENALLSHDLFEGIVGRAGLVADVVVLENYPDHYLASIERQHRWMRGDWQLLPWLLPWVPAESGGAIPNDFSTLDRWKILDNLRRSLLAPSLLALLIAGWLWLPGPTLFWTGVAVLHRAPRFWPALCLACACACQPCPPSSSFGRCGWIWFAGHWRSSCCRSRLCSRWMPSASRWRACCSPAGDCSNGHRRHSSAARWVGAPRAA